MITKEDILEKLQNPILGDTHRDILKLALKGLESESTVKQVTQDRDNWKMMHEDLVCVHRIAVLRRELMLQNERDESNAKTKTIFEASKIINDAREKHRDLEDELTNFKTRYDQLCREHLTQNDHLRNGRRKAEDQIAVLEDKLKDTVSLQHHNETVNPLYRRISALLNERDSLHHCISEMQTENHCKRADLENVCKERDDLKGEIEKWEEAHRNKNADIDKLITENKELARLERELRVVLGEWAAVEVYLHKSPKLTIGDKVTVACLRLLQERDKLEADLRFLLGH